MLGQNRATDRELLPPDILPEVVVTWLQEDHFRYPNDESAVARY